MTRPAPTDAPKQCWQGKRASIRVTQAQADRLKRLYDLHNGTVAAEIVGVSLNTITRLKRNGWKAYDQVHRQRPMPNDFPLVCQRLPIKDLQKHYGASQRVIYRWLDQTNRDYERRHCGPEPLAVPPRDELERAINRFGATATARFYGVHRNTMQRWREALGLPLTERYALKRKLKERAAKTDHWADRYFADRKAA